MYRLAGKRLLLVEDDDVSAALWGGVFKAGDVIHDRAADLKAALTLLRSRCYDAAVADLTLPDSCGTDTVRDVRAAAPVLPLVVMTGSDDPELVAACRKAGADDYLVKGRHGPADLFFRVEAAVERRQNAGLRAKMAAVAHEVEKLKAVTAPDQLTEAIHRLRALVQGDSLEYPEPAEDVRGDPGHAGGVQGPD